MEYQRRTATLVPPNLPTESEVNPMDPSGLRYRTPRQKSGGSVDEQGYGHLRVQRAKRGHPGLPEAGSVDFPEIISTGGAASSAAGKPRAALVNSRIDRAWSVLRGNRRSMDMGPSVPFFADDGRIDLDYLRAELATRLPKRIRAKDDYWGRLSDASGRVAKAAQKRFEQEWNSADPIGPDPETLAQMNRPGGPLDYRLGSVIRPLNAAVYHGVPSVLDASTRTVNSTFHGAISGAGQLAREFGAPNSSTRQIERTIRALPEAFPTSTRRLASAPGAFEYLSARAAGRQGTHQRRLRDGPALRRKLPDDQHTRPMPNPDNYSSIARGNGGYTLDLTKRNGPVTSVEDAAAYRFLDESGIRIASPNSPIPSNKQITPLLQKIRQAGKTLPINRGEVSAQDLAALHRMSGNEMAIYRDRASGQLYLKELGQNSGIVPDNSRLIIHSHPNGSWMALKPSLEDRASLARFKQKSSVIIDSDGSHSIRFRSDIRKDEEIHRLFGVKDDN